jgi:hypothetical protein
MIGLKQGGCGKAGAKPVLLSYTFEEISLDDSRGGLM